MLIHFEIDQNLHNIIIFPSPFNQDIDPRETITNIKVLVSLNFNNVDPEQFDLVFPDHPHKILEQNKTLLQYIGQVDVDKIYNMKLVKAASKVCLLI